jgi:CRP/FNR family cyclic AMP-dependent transcriptional regulator
VKPGTSGDLRQGQPLELLTGNIGLLSLGHARRARRIDVALGRTSPLDLPLFADLSGREIKDIFRAGEEVSVPAGWSLILEQTPPDAAYLILSGTAAVRVKGEEIAELGPGDIAGEVAVRQNRLRTATVTAKSRLQLLHFTREKFDDLTNRLPNFRDAIDATIAERRGDKSGS